MTALLNTDRFEKDPDETRDFGVDWTAYLKGGETITTSTWLIPTGVTHLAAGAADSHTTTTTTVWLTAGNLGQTCRCVNRVVTSASRTYDKSIYVEIKSL